MATELKEERMNLNSQKRLEVSLLLLRLGVFTVMLMWTVDKFVRVDHAKVVFEKFYFLNGLEAALLYVIGS
ncbi:MAG: hypothetical protein COT73_05690, partial [Bdellovibrio sp. CG10_big_fil_rev_8_21_14_0_10_47_8]